VGALVHPAEDSANPPLAPLVPILGTPDDWEKAVIASAANVVVVAYPAVPTGGGELEKMLHGCKKRRVDVEIYSSLLATENLNYEHDEFSGCFRFFSKPAWSLALQRAVKAGIDLVTGILGSIVTLLMIPIIYVLVNLDDPGPLFFRSAYVSQDGSNRFYLKFRTMRKDAEHFLERNPELRAQFQEKQKLIDDPRVTRLGHFLRKYSIDEFPQFFSILTGHLSLVGPRTIRQEEKSRYGAHLEELLSCKPGLTGFWQVMGRQTTTYPERVQMDMFYINRWSIWLDLLIVAKTFWKVIRAEGAY
jgi:lipopolysaccharide/colanic/teichoic acid biosynthesis glycosyltransferase